MSQSATDSPAGATKAAVRWASASFGELRISARLILLTAVILGFEGAEGDFFVSREAVLRVTKISKRTVIRELIALRRAALMRRDPRKVDQRPYDGPARWRAGCFESVEPAPMPGPEAQAGGNFVGALTG